MQFSSNLKWLDCPVYVLVNMHIQSKLGIIIFLKFLMVLEEVAG